MPLPHYIIGSMSQSQDKITGLISYFHVVEKLQIAAFGPLPPGLDRNDLASTIFVAASWLREPSEDQSTVFESEWWVRFPTKPEAERMHEHTFQITESFARIGLHLGVLPVTTGQGLAYVENKVRASGSDMAWQSQRFNFLMEIKAIPPVESEPKKDS